MGERLIQAFAIEDPGHFARLLGTSHDIAEAVEILNRIPDGAEGEVLNQLSPESGDRLINGLPDELLAAWLGTCPTDVGRRLMARIGAERSAVLIAGIKDPAKRRGLRRMASYPAGSIGAYMNDKVMAILHSASAAEIEDLYRLHQAGPDAPAVIIGPEDRVMGMLDLAALVANDEKDARADEFCIAVQPVHAETPVTSLLDRKNWQLFSSLPVVDFQDRLVGYITRSAVEAATASDRPGNVFLDSVVELSSRYMQFLAHMMALIISRRAER